MDPSAATSVSRARHAPCRRGRSALRAALLFLVASLLLVQPLRAQDISAEAVRGEIRAGHYERAADQARQLVTANERLYGANSLPVAEALDLLAESLRRGGKIVEPEGLAACLRALRIKETQLSSDDPSLAVTLENLGALHVAKGERAAARRPLERALEIREHAYGPVHADVARSLLYLANLENAESRKDEAVALVERAIAIQDSVVSPEDPMRAMALRMLAVFRFELGDFREAGRAWERVLSLQTRVLGADHPTTLSTAHNLGALYVEMGDYEEGRHYLERTLRMMRRALDANHPLIARTLRVLGLALESTGDLKGALKRYNEALRIQRKALGSGNADYAWTLMKRGRVELKLGQTRRAVRTLHTALRTQMETLRAGDPDMGWTLSSLGAAEAAGGALDSALVHVRRAVDIQEHALGPMHPDLAPSIARLSRIHAMRGDTIRAIEAALRSARIRTEHLRLTAGGLAERQALSYAAESSTGLDQALALIGYPGSRSAPAAVRRVWDAVIQTRTMVLDEMALRHRAALADTADSATRAARIDLRGARQRLANLLVRGPASDTPAQYEALLRRARLDMERAERELGARSAAFGVRQTEAQSGLNEVLAALPRGWGLVAYAIASTDEGRRYVALVRGAGVEPQAVDLGDADRIDGLVTRWAESLLRHTDDTGKAVGRGEADWRATGEALRAAVWDPLVDVVGAVDALFLVPEGALHTVNFGALPASGGYLIEEDVVLHYITSEKDILPPTVEHDRGVGLLALGGVAFGAATDSRSAAGSNGAGGADPPGTKPTAWDCTDFREARFMPLPESGREVEEIAALWEPPEEATVITGKDATEAAFKRLAPGKRVLHLATHGFFLDPDRCLPVERGARGIGGIETTVRPARSTAFQQQNPLLLSGLALAAANRRSEASVHEEDGILTAEEVASLDLRGVDWAVLSACDTGVAGIARGEGILGLRRAFQTAGVATLVISLWPVQDQATREWMGALYRYRFHEGLDTARAVRAATLDALQSRRAQGRSTNPFFWAAFLAAGDWK